MFEKLKKLHHQELFLYGFFISYGLGTLIASILALLLDQPLNMIVTLSASVVTLMTYIYYKKYKYYELTALALLWNASIVVFIHIILNKYSIDIAFSLLIPMAASLLLSKKSLFLHGSIYLFILIGLFVYGYFSYPEHPFLHDPNLMASYFMLTFFVFAFGATYHFAIASSYTRLEKANQQKAFLLKEIHHRVKNNLNIVASILGLEKFESNTKEVHQLIMKNKLRIESIAMVHEILYKNSNLEHIDFETYIRKLSKHILTTESQDNSIDITFDIVKLELNIEPMMQFGIILNELITNSIKHAFSAKGGKISIALAHVEDGYTLTYKDNGKGSLSKPKGFGSSLIEMSIQQMDGQLKHSIHNGFMCEIFFIPFTNKNR